MAADPIYFNSLSGKRGKYGIRISGKASEVIAEIIRNQNSAGYINLEVKERRTEGKFGQTHYVIVDTYDGRSSQPSQPAPKAPVPPPAVASQSEDDDLPF